MSGSNRVKVQTNIHLPFFLVRAETEEKPYIALKSLLSPTDILILLVTLRSCTLLTLRGKLIAY